MRDQATREEGKRSTSKSQSCSSVAGIKVGDEFVYNLSSNVQCQMALGLVGPFPGVFLTISSRKPRKTIRTAKACTGKMDRKSTLTS